MAKAWSVEELQASVQAYMEMLASEQASNSYNKNQVYLELSKRFNRTEKAFEYRMQNISYALDAMGRKWISGLKPAKNVGNGIANTIESQILIREGQEPSSANLVFPKRKASSGIAKEDTAAWPFFGDEEDGDDSEFTEEPEEVKTQTSFGRQSKSIPHQKSVLIEPQGVVSPKAKSTLRTEFLRDPAVVSWVLARSGGHCECCLKPAPFAARDGTPFLEVHHLRQLAELGSDRPTNAVAVCPNCHRELHYGDKSEALLKNIYARIPALKDE